MIADFNVSVANNKLGSRLEFVDSPLWSVNREIEEGGIAWEAGVLVVLRPREFAPPPVVREEAFRRPFRAMIAVRVLTVGRRFGLVSGVVRGRFTSYTNKEDDHNGDRESHTKSRRIH